VRGAPDSVLFSPGVDARFGRGEVLGRERRGPASPRALTGASAEVGNVRA
jgi:hypothetical protein